MKKHEVEHWVNQTVDHLLQTGHVEDSYVELKSEFPNGATINRAARQLGGHANAARGEHILWLIGVDEGAKRIVGADPTQVADWYAQIQSCFDGLAPGLAIDINVPHRDGVIVAMLFETDRAPYVVRPSKQEAVHWEVPWREGRSTRSATRKDLLAVLVPAVRVPDVQLLSCSLEVNTSSQPAMPINLTAELYFVPRNNDPSVFPIHLCSVTADFSDVFENLLFEGLVLQPPKRPLAESVGFGSIPRYRYVDASTTIDGGPGELVVRGPGKATLRCKTAVVLSDAPDLVRSNDWLIAIKLNTLPTSREVIIPARLVWRGSTSTGLETWALPAT